MKRILAAILGGMLVGWIASLGFNSTASFISVTYFFISMGILVAWMLVLFQVIQQQKKSLLSLSQEKQNTELELQTAHHRFKTVFDCAPIGMALVNLDGRFFKVNYSLCELLGYSEEDMLAMNFFFLFSSNEMNNLQINIQHLIDKKISTYYSEQECFRKGGEVLWVMVALSVVYNNEDKPLHFSMQVQNISLQKKAEERLRHMAYHDPLTGLANRNKLEQFIHHIIATARRHEQVFALMYLDLDRFKNINDTIGHEAGDLVLQVIAERLRSSVRSTDMIARLGGDEFVLVISDVTTTESVGYIAQKVLETVLKVMMISGQEVYITTSIGISLYPHDGQDIQMMMKNSDLALYRAKEGGRNNYQFYTSQMTEKAKEKLALQDVLGHALAKNEFFLEYQPKMEIKTRRITGVEALLRWKNKEYAITPDAIISLAEETGFIIPVSEWIIKTACEQLKSWHHKGLLTLTMAVNCSPRQFKQATFIDDLLRILKEVDIPPSAFEIEITEFLIMKDPENTLRILYGLKDVGIQISIDDFGTGYWSLNHLRKLTVDKIKIDRSFIRQMMVDESSATIIRAIIAMTNKLGIISIAEGVETREQYEFLADEGCSEIQGYYLSKPLSEENISQFLKHPVPDAEVM